MKKKSNLFSDKEWIIMKAVWQKQKITVKEAWQQIYPNQEKAYTTVQTYMDRLAEKGVLKKEKLGLVNFYQALITEEQALDKATENLVSRAFNGSFGLLAAFLIDSQRLDPSDLEKIKKLLREKGSKA